MLDEPSHKYAIKVSCQRVFIDQACVVRSVEYVMMSVLRDAFARAWLCSHCMIDQLDRSADMVRHLQHLASLSTHM